MVFVIVHLFFIFDSQEAVLAFFDKLSSEAWFSSLKHVFKGFIKHGVNYILQLLLQPWLQHTELFLMVNHHNIILETLVEVLTYSLENVTWHLLCVLKNSADGHEPVINFFILTCFQVILSNALEDLLESTGHVAKEAHSSDFDEHLEQVLVRCRTLDVSIAYR
jgi:hypothetical protein